MYKHYSKYIQAPPKQYIPKNIYKHHQKNISSAVINISNVA